MQDTQRPKVKGNWVCIGCKNPVNELPFQPAPGRENDILCYDCHRAKTEARKAAGPRQPFTGNWTCVKCNNPITSLPFQPTRTDNLMCRDCYQR